MMCRRTMVAGIGGTLGSFLVALAFAGADVRYVQASEAGSIRGRGHALLASPPGTGILFGIREKCKSKSLKSICDLENPLGICRGVCDTKTRICAPTVSACFPCHPGTEEDPNPSINRCSRGGFFCTERTGLAPAGCGDQTIGQCVPASCKKKDIITCTAGCADTGINTGNPCSPVQPNCP